MSEQLKAGIYRNVDLPWLHATYSTRSQDSSIENHYSSLRCYTAINDRIHEIHFLLNNEPPNFVSALFQRLWSRQKLNRRRRKSRSSLFWSSSGYRSLRLRILNILRYSTHDHLGSVNYCPEVNLLLVGKECFQRREQLHLKISADGSERALSTLSTAATERTGIRCIEQTDSMA